MNQGDSLQKKLQRFLDENGIETAVLVIRDPDGDCNVSARRGDHLWCLGALRGMQLEMEMNWIIPPDWAKTSD